MTTAMNPLAPAAERERNDLAETISHPLLRAAVALTETYRAHQDAHPALREAACLRAQYPALLAPIGPDDLFAGGHPRDHIAYTGGIWWAMMPSECGPGKQGGYCFDFDAADKLALTKSDRAIYDDLKDFWRDECTWAKISRTWPEDLRTFNRREGQIRGAGNGFCLAPDLDPLLQKGLPGLATDIAQRTERARDAGDHEKLPFLQGLAETVELIADIARHYRQQALAQAAAVDSPQDHARLERIADSLDALTQRAPATLHEAIQLWWLTSVPACGRHIEGWRLDVTLGDFYARALDEQGMETEEAQALVDGLWKMFDRYSDPAVSRVIVGGRGRRNESAADRFCFAAMEACRRSRQVIPQLTLRFYDGQNPDLLTRAYDVLGEGCVFPMLYNDDVNIPGVQKALNVTAEDAVDYYPLGCGEYMIGGASPSLLNLLWSVPKTVEAALRGGRTAAREEIGLFGPGEFADFDKLWEELRRQIGFAADLCARTHALNAAVMTRENAFLIGSLFTHDCLERGEPLLNGGARYNGACVMGHGFTNAADSLVAIKQLVFEEKSTTLPELLKALEENFAGHESLRRRLQSAPKFGNDQDATDTLVNRLWQEISQALDDAGRRHGLDFLTISSVNPGGYLLGENCGATADGRLAGEPFAIGNAPTAGADTHGITALLNSVSKIDPANGGAVTSIKLGAGLFQENRLKLEALLAAFWKRGGMQATLTVVDQTELEAAMDHPENYPHLLVRVGGWTARFIDLEKPVQREVIRRTLY